MGLGGAGQHGALVAEIEAAHQLVEEGEREVDAARIKALAMAAKRRLAKAREDEQAVLSRAGFVSWLSFQMRRIDVLLEPDALEALRVAELEHQVAPWRWAELAGDVDPEAALAARAEIERYAAQMADAEHNVEATELLHRELVEDAEPALAAARAALLEACRSFDVEPEHAVSEVAAIVSEARHARLQQAVEDAEAACHRIEARARGPAGRRRPARPGPPRRPRRGGHRPGRRGRPPPRGDRVDPQPRRGRGRPRPRPGPPWPAWPGPSGRTFPPRRPSRSERRRQPATTPAPPRRREPRRPGRPPHRGAGPGGGRDSSPPAAACPTSTAWPTAARRWPAGSTILETSAGTGPLLVAAEEAEMVLLGRFAQTRRVGPGGRAHPRPRRRRPRRLPPPREVAAARPPRPPRRGQPGRLPDRRRGDPGLGPQPGGQAAASGCSPPSRAAA